MAFKPLKRINWMEISGLLVGIFFTVAVMVFAIVLYAKLFSSGMIGVEEYRLHSTFEKAFGLRPGTRVQISGVDVGQIGEMEIEGDGVKMGFIIRKQYQNWITDSAQVFAIRDQNLISARVVNIDVRRGKGRVLQDGDFLPPGQAQDIETVLETANEILGRVNKLINAADTLVGMAMDTGTTIGALFGSRLLYDNLNRQLNRLDDITYVGKKVLFQASGLFDTMQVQVPVLLGKVDGIADNVSGMMTELKPMPQKLDNLLGSVDGMMDKMDNTFGRVDGLLNEVGQVTAGLSDFMEATEQTLQNADDLMAGISNMWIVRRSMPSKDSVPFMVETLW
jgi:phospholipid/cholesterol/gamma-HCH transport system substrate-binding protein